MERCGDLREMVAEEQIVDLVLGQLAQKKSDSEIRTVLGLTGVPDADTSSVVDCVRKGYQAGTIAVVTGGISAQEMCPGQNLLFDMAFKRGKAAMRFTTPGWVLLRMIWPFLLVFAILIAGIVIWRIS